MRWIIDTSAWARRDQPGIAAQVQAIVDEQPGSELVLTTPILIELLRGPQGRDAVAREHQDLVAAMLCLDVTEAVCALAVEAIIELAAHDPGAHRVPVSDALTAACAAHYGCGVIHADVDFELLAEHSGLEFPQRRLTLAASQGSSPAARQRELRKELAALLHQVPVADAEALLERAVSEARALIGPAA